MASSAQTAQLVPGGPPVATQPIRNGGLLAPGQFYSSTAERRRQRKDYMLSELVQAEARRLPVHSHQLDYFFFVLDGHFQESDWRGVREFSAMSGGFNPSDTPHDGRVGPQGVRFFTIELLADFVQQSGVRLPTAPVVDHGGRRMLWSGLRLFREFRAGRHDAADSLTRDSLIYDSLVCEMLADAADYRAADRDTAPEWLRRTCEMLDDLHSVEVSIASLADDAGVHPVHLARVFRRVHGITPGEYRQRTRIRLACDRLLNSPLPLADIAMLTGFSDQSHMTRTFRRLLGITPGAFRAQVAASRCQ